MAEPDLMADVSIWDVPGQPSPVDTIYASLNQSLGTAYDTSEESPVTAETKAEARLLAAAWRSNRRMALQFDPRYMTDFIPRWEAIFGINPPSGATDDARRAVLQARFLLLSGRGTLQDTVAAILGANLVAIEYTPVASAYKRWPDNGFPNDWISHTAHIVIRVQFLGGQTEVAFLELMNTLTRTLESFLPAWVTFDWATFAENGLDGFYRDEPSGGGPPPNNLNYEVIDS